MLEGRERDLVAIAAQDVDELRRIGHQPAPAVGLGDLARIGLIEAYAGQHHGAGVFHGPRQPMRSAADLISGEVVTTSAVAGLIRRPASASATACISNSDNCGAENTTMSSFSPGAA